MTRSFAPNWRGGFPYRPVAEQSGRPADLLGHWAVACSDLRLTATLVPGATFDRAGMRMPLVSVTVSSSMTCLAVPAGYTVGG